MALDRVITPISWKLEEHRELKSVGRNHNLFLDFLSGSYRQKAYREWLDYPLRYAELQGCKFTPDTPARTLKEIFVDGVYNVSGFVPSKGDVVADVGANYGDSAIWWAKVHGAHVIAFEPLENVYATLCRNIRDNKINSIATHNIALGKGERLSGYSNGDMFIAGSKGSQKLYDSVPMDTFKFEKLDLLKVDVEGFELDVLEGARETIKKHMPKIILEVHSTILKEECSNLLSEFGYRIVHEGRTVKSAAPGMDLVQNLFLTSSTGSNEEHTEVS